MATHNGQPTTGNRMHNFQIAMLNRYATDANLKKIAQINPDVKITLFEIKKQHPKISKMRGAFRRILPYNVYALFSGKLDEYGDKQKLVWTHSPAKFVDKNTALLFPPNLEFDVAKELLSLLNPSWIHSIMTGIDRIPAIPDKTLVTNSKGIHSERIAEFVMGYIFAAAKNLPEHFDLNRKRIWKMLPSKMIKGARLGIVGLGSIGLEVAKIAKINGMEVWATKRNIFSLDFVDRLLTPQELPDLLRKVDYVVLTVPLTKDTRNLIGKAELDMMKNTACLVNICRGAVVDEDALYDALKNKSIRAACIDIFKNERPIPKNSRFYQLPNILITNWSSWFSENANEQRMELFFNNLERFMNGKPLLNLVENSQVRHR